MNQANEGNNSDAISLLLGKRKRGRPRKDQSMNRREAARVPPGFERVNGNLRPQVDPVNDANDSMVGRTVTGVVEAVFDAGYLLAVNIGNSNITLRGVVFKPGHYAPVTAENDVAPHAQMIRRTETQNLTRVRGQKRRRNREKNMQLVSYVGNGSLPSNQEIRHAPPSKGVYVPAPSVPLVGSRGTVVPVILQPVNPSNGLLSGLSANQATQMTSLKGKHVQTVLPLTICPPNGSTSQALPTQPKTNPQVTPTGLRTDNGPLADPIKSGDAHLQGEANEVARGSSQSSGTQNVGSKPGQEIADMNEPLFIEPLQMRHTNLHVHPARVSRPVESNRTRRMLELLQAVQGNMAEGQISPVEHSQAGSM